MAGDNHSMRILFVTNYYPPSSYGWGYMQLCEEVAEGLTTRGHEIAVLTSTYIDGPQVAHPYPVYRRLTLDPDWHSGKPVALQFIFGRRQRERKSVRNLLNLLNRFSPQVIFIWHAVGLPRVLLHAAEVQTSSETVYYLADYQTELPDEYMAYWQQPPVHLIAKLLKKPLSRFALAELRREGKPILLQYENAICVSDHVRQRLRTHGLISQDAVVIHNGVDVQRFVGSPNASRSSSPSSCLVAGRVIPEKGIHTAIEAFAELASWPETHHLKLVILGEGPADYLAQLHKKVEEDGLKEMVTFNPPVPRTQMPDVMKQHQILLLPSEYEEPIARSMQEAMAMGLLVIGTATGGSSELLIHEQTGLVFEAGNAQSLARQIQRVLADRALETRLAWAGQQLVREKFTIQHTVEQIEDYLVQVVKPNSKERL